LINLDEKRPRPLPLGTIVKAIGVLLTCLTIIVSVSTLYERTKETSLDLSLEQTVSGYFLRVVNSGNTTAISARVDLESWPVGAPWILALVFSASRSPAWVRYSHSDGTGPFILA